MPISKSVPSVQHNRWYCRRDFSKRLEAVTAGSVYVPVPVVVVSFDAVFNNECHLSPQSAVMSKSPASIFRTSPEAIVFAFGTHRSKFPPDFVKNQMAHAAPALSPR